MDRILINGDQVSNVGQQLSFLDHWELNIDHINSRLEEYLLEEK